ncbi:MAG TPA: proton-conducting transporter membrane subunit [Chitinophagaceae bacterium]|nr:proton-conducting transporter membrane subunit [Chitinophagaceae bacterium]
MMGIIEAFILIILLAVTLIPFVNVQWKGVITITAVCIIAFISSIIAIGPLTGSNFEYLLHGSLVTGEIPVRIDALSAVFILIINFTFITGAFYGLQYMKAYRTQKANLSLHCISFILVLASLISICSLQNSIAFLIAWEIMALSSFILVVFEHYKRKTLNAGINFLVQSHICIMFLTLAFIWVAMKMNSYDFTAIALFSSSNSMLTGIALFLCFFAGFAIKAGFVPFHTWLPYAHPAAPSHVSGIMSGVIIKIGIYGILRMLLLIKTDYLVIGYIILFFSIVSGIYGVMLAIIQHNLKRLLAYHSIENIGIIGIGIGLGCIGIGKGNNELTVLGFAGALLHTLNHSLFKSLLFYGAGNVYQSTHTMDIDKSGGLGKLMPQTSFLFLLASLAICGLPPFNGFVSEFLIYNGMFAGLRGSDKVLLSWIVSGLFGLALIGGLAMLCFTKAFGTVFLGTSRHSLSQVPREAGSGKLVPMYAIAVLIMAIGLFPAFFVTMLSKPIALFTNLVSAGNLVPDKIPALNALTMIGIGAAGFILLAGVIYFIRNKIILNKPVHINTTWSCGYVGQVEKMQYTASSFIRAYRKLAEPILSIHKNKKEIKGIFPKGGGQETHPYDKAEEWLIDYPLQLLKTFLNRFTFLQNGNLQFYLLYGIVFITLALGVPLAIEYTKSLINFLKDL